MVRNKNIIFAERNDEDTVLAAEDSNEFVEYGLITAAGTKSIRHKIIEDLDYGKILYLVDGKVQELKIQPNKKLGTDASGNLVWI